MLIELDKHFRIKTASLNYILEVYKPPREHRGKIISESWEEVGYYTSLRSVLKAYLEKSVNEVDATDFEQVVAKVEEVKEVIQSIKVSEETKSLIK